MASGPEYPKKPEYSMSSANSMDQLMQGPLVAWVRTFKDDDESRTELDYSQLIDGAFLDNVLSRIDPRTNGRAHIQPAEDVYTRIRNFDALVRAVKGFYEDVLGQFVLVRLPDPVTLGRDPDSETGLAGMQTLLLLVLGCAVQGPSKESVIEDIKRLPLATQHDIVNCIQQVADNPACVWNKEWTEFESLESAWADKEEQQQQREELFRVLVQHLRRLVQERDDYAHHFTAMVLRELSSNGGNTLQRHNSASPQSGVVVELAEAKAKIRRWRQELEEKCEQVAELRDELDALKTHSVKIKQENMDLVQEARLSKALRDELDIVRERASKVDRLESELNRYKDKLNDIDYYKARLDELREDNRLLEETKVILEGQLESARQRAELVLDLEGELLKCKSQLTNLLVEKEADKERLKKLAEENAHWQLCTKNCLSESASLTAELESLRAHQAFSDTSKDQFTNLGEQMSSVDLLGKARRLEMENQRLTNLLSSNNAKESGLRGDNGEKILQLEGECTRLKLRLADLEEERRTKENHMTEMMAAVTLRTAEVDRQNQDLQRNHQEQKNLIENLKVERCKIEELELQVSSLGAENQKLQRSADLFQRRVDSVQNESRDLESENAKLHKTVESLRHSLRRLNDLEKENTDLESENHRLDRESKGLHKEIVRLKQAIEVKDASLDEFCSKLSTAEREWKRLSKEVSALQTQGSKLRELERDNKELQQSSIVEHKTLAAIREELVQEKIRCQQLQCQLDTNIRTIELNRVERDTLKNTNEELTQRCASAAATSAELSALKSEVPSAQQQESLPPTLELGREVLAVKDRLVELERQNAVLLAEKDNLTAQICSQKERVNESGSQLAILSQKLATLQVENSTLASQLDSTTTQNSGIQAALTAVESEREKLAAQLQSSDTRLERVSRDQQELQTLHEQLQSEYDALLAEREQLKICQRESKTELRALHDQLATSSQAETEWQRSRSELQEELDKSRAETRSLTNLRAEHSRLKDDFRSLFVANEKLKSEYKSLQNDYKGLRGDHNTLKLKHTQLQGEASESRHQVTNLDVELSKLNNKCDVLQQWNTTLEEDKRNLVNQVSVLLTQYHELLSQTLEEKDHFHEETKNFSDKLNHLKRQKEILEDKIMEQYRRMENSPNLGGGSPFKKNAKASIGALFVRKMRRASSELISRVPRSRSRNRVGDGLPSGDRESPDQHDGQLDTFSLESGSHSGSNSGCGSLDGGSGGEDMMTPTSLIGSISGVSPGLTSGGSGTGWNERDRNRQSMPIIHYQHPESLENSIPTASVRHSISSDGVCNGSLTTANQINGNPTTQSSPLSVNGNSAGTESDGSTHVSAATNTSQPKASLSGGLISAAPLMMMAPCSPQLPQPSPRLDGIVSGFQGSSTPTSGNSPIPIGALQRFTQSSRSLALLERAGSRQPLCLSEVEPSLVLSETPSSLALPLASRSSPLLTPRNISPAGSDSMASGGGMPGSSSSNNKNNNNNNHNHNHNSGSIRSGAAAALVQTSTTGTSPTPLDSSTPNSKLFPHLTSTTRINVNISTAAITPLIPSPASPLLPGPLERRGSLRLPPRPSPRITSAEAPPLLPARLGNQERPALPPRSYSTNNPATPSTVEEKPTEDPNVNGSTTGAGSASSIWYEYGCV